MPFVLPRFCAVIDPAVRPDPAHAGLDDIARALTGAGVRLIQLRDKQATSQALLSQARQLLSLLPPECLLIINDRADVARLAGAAGVHLGQEDLPPDAARALLGPDRLIGWSTHHPEQVEQGNVLPVDYLAFGPVFPTATKPDAEPVVGLAGLRAAHRRTKKPLVAIGGITPANAAQALEAGADGVAVISAWLVPTKGGLAAPDIPARLEEFRRNLGRLD